MGETTKKFFALFVMVLLILELPSAAFAQEKKVKKYSSISALKSDFVKTGGQCWEWKRNPKMFEDQITADCDKKTVLIYFLKEVNTLNRALSMATTYRSLGFPVNLLVGPNWIINSDQVKIVSKKLGGTLITR